MTTGLYDSADIDWPEPSLFRDLLIADSDELATYIRYHRPLHLAVTAVDPTLAGDTTEVLHALLRIITTQANSGRYARIILVSEMRTNVWEAVITFIADHYLSVLSQRRVFCSWARPTDEGVDRMYRAIGAAQAVSLQDGVWRAPSLL